MGKENSKRIQTSLLNNAEKKVLIRLAKRQPKWMTSDMLTYIGVFGSALYMLGGWLANTNIHFLWLASLGLIIHWYGDSLDGTLARVRNTQRPVYGFFIDHSLDAVTTCMIFIGSGLSPVFRMDVALFILIGYLCLSVYTYICTILKGEFRLTYAAMGPTEFRLLLILINMLYLYVPCMKRHYNLGQYDLGLFDIIGVLVGLALFLIYICQLIKDGRAFSKQDPLHS